MEHSVFHLGCKLRNITHVLLAICILSLAPGCASYRNGTYPTLQATDVQIHWLMTRYRQALWRSALTTGERERIDVAYADYHAAFEKALQQASGNYDTPTPPNVKALANRLISVISATPKSTGVW